MKSKGRMFTVVVVAILLSSYMLTGQSSINSNENNGTPTGWSEDIRLTYAIPDSDAYTTISIWENNVHISWRKLLADRSNICYISSNDGGQNWDNIIQMNNNISGLYCFSPDICVNDDMIYTVWDDTNATAREIRYRSSPDSGQTWLPEKMVSANDGWNSQYAKIAVNGSEIHVVWVDYRHRDESFPFNTELYYMRSLDNGITWDDGMGNIGQERRLTNAFYESTEASISVEGDVVQVVWGDTRNGVTTGDIYYMRSLDKGATWDDGLGNVGQDRRLTTNGTNHGPSTMAVNGSTIHVAWVDEEPGPVYRIYYRNSTDNGLSWGTIQSLVGPLPGSTYRPKLAVYNDTVHMTWMDMRDDGSTREIYYKNSTDRGANWNADLRLTNSTGTNSWWPVIDVNEKEIHIAWWDDRDGNSEIYYKRYPDFPTPDTEPPEIRHDAIAPTVVGQTINITANVTDNVGVDAVYLNYAGVNGTTYNVSMQKWGGNYSYDIPGQNNTGIVEYFIWANDTSGNANQTGNYTVQIIDITAPEIVHTPEPSVNVFDTINITASVTDDVAVDFVFLNYTDVHGDYQNISMAKWNGNWSFGIPGQTNTGVVQYFIWANDTSNNANMTMNYTIQIYDVTAPIITHAPPPATPVNTPITIVANVTDDVGVDEVWLHYASVDDTDYTAVDMAIVSGNWTATIPAQEKTGTVHYYIWANDTSGNNATSPTMGAHIVQITGPPGIAVSQGKRRLSTTALTDLPIDLQGFAGRPVP